MSPFSIPRAETLTASEPPADQAPAFVLRCPRWLTADEFSYGGQGIFILASDPLDGFFDTTSPAPNFSHDEHGTDNERTDPVSEWEIIDGGLYLRKLTARHCTAHQTRRGCLRRLSPCAFEAATAETYFSKSTEPIFADWFSGPLALHLPSEHDAEGTPFLTIEFTAGRVSAVGGDYDDLVASQLQTIEKLSNAIRSLQNPDAEEGTEAASRFDPAINTKPVTKPKAGMQGMGYLAADIWASEEDDDTTLPAKPGKGGWATAAKLVSVFLLGAWWAWLIMNHTQNW